MAELYHQGSRGVGSPQPPDVVAVLAIAPEGPGELRQGALELPGGPQRSDGLEKRLDVLRIPLPLVGEIGLELDEEFEEDEEELEEEEEDLW